jgi:hypothetical protein
MNSSIFDRHSNKAVTKNVKQNAQKLDNFYEKLKKHVIRIKTTPESRKETEFFTKKNVWETHESSN